MCQKHFCVPVSHPFTHIDHIRKASWARPLIYEIAGQAGNDGHFTSSPSSPAPFPSSPAPTWDPIASRRGITLFLPYRLLICFTFITLTCVGQSNALEFVFKLKLPSVCRKIGCRYTVFLHLSAVDKQITAVYLFTDLSKHNSARLIYFCKYRFKCDCF